MTVALSIVLPSALCFWQEENKSVISSIVMVVPGLLGPGSGYPYHCYCCYNAANPVNASSGFNICNYPYSANILTNTPCKELDSLWPPHQVSGVLRTTCQRRVRPAFIVIPQSRRRMGGLVGVQMQANWYNYEKGVKFRDVFQNNRIV